MFEWLAGILSCLKLSALLLQGVEQDRTHQQNARQGVNFAHQELGHYF
jgi:hypothetical protein